MNEDFNDESAAPHPNWLWKVFHRMGGDLLQDEDVNSIAGTAPSVLVYIAVCLVALFFASACVMSLPARFLTEHEVSFQLEQTPRVQIGS